jgi:hypothetical protein
MLIVAMCSLLIAAAAWMMHSDSSLFATAGYLLVAGGVLLRALLSATPQARWDLQRLTGLLLAGLPLAWYVLNIMVEPMAPVSRRHVGELLGAVLPGIMLGMAAALGVQDMLSSRLVDGRSRWRDHMRWMFYASVVVVWCVAAFLAANTGEGVLLVSTARLAGAETYQTLGDMLSMNLLVVYCLSSILNARPAPSRPRPRFGTGGMVWLALGTLSCAVLVGSNKLLLISVIVLGHLAVRAWWRSAARWSILSLLLLLVVAASAWLGMGRSSGDGLALNDLLALTRLLDYGNVDSLLDTPSITSRTDILSECGGRQLRLNPWVGDLAAEFKTCGDGNYLHSLVSVQTHLGAMGSLLFTLALGCGLVRVWRAPAYRAMRLPAALLIGVGFIGAFFTWMPFWFVLTWMLTLGRPPVGSPAGRAGPAAA